MTSGAGGLSGEITRKDLGMQSKDQDCGLLNAKVALQVLGVEGTDPWGGGTNGEITRGSRSPNNLPYQSGFPEILSFDEDCNHSKVRFFSLSNLRLFLQDFDMIRYFTRTILQFQFAAKLCDISGHTGPLHR